MKLNKDEALWNRIDELENTLEQVLTMIKEYRVPVDTAELERVLNNKLMEEVPTDMLIGDEYVYEKMDPEMQRILYENLMDLYEE